MRPLRLELKGFTAFRDPAEIDFAQLDVFAVSGPTGSGKSSLLDAMTYALYGRVERVGDRVSLLISQGQPRMAVTFEFEVGRDRYRVTRSTPVKGATKILLEKQDRDGQWRQAGEGADRVKGVDPAIAKTIGLTYDGFTRSVLLPQGKFAEFLNGDPAKRRNILTELLGLSLFKRMAERAGAIARESAVRSQERGHLLEREYADATPEALKEAKAAAKAAEKREMALAKAAEQLIEILGRWREAEASLDEIRACVKEGRGAAEEVAAILDTLRSVDDRLRAATAQVKDRRAAFELARKAFTEAAAELADADRMFGTVADLTRAQARALGMADAIVAGKAKADQMGVAVQAAQAASEELENAERLLAARIDAQRAADADSERAEMGLKEAQHADMASALMAGKKVGDPCPICGLPLAEIPRRASATVLSRAEKALEKARAALDAARAEALRAERARHAAEREVESNASNQRRLTAELAELEARVASDQEALRRVLDSPIPRDAAGAIQERLDAIRHLSTVERDASRMAGESENALMKAEQEAERTELEVTRAGDRLMADRQPLFDRGERALGARLAIRLPGPPPKDDAGSRQAFGQKLGTALVAFADRMAAELEERATLEDRLLEEANERVAGLVEPAVGLESLAVGVNAAFRTATADAATAAQLATTLAERLESKKQLSEEVKTLDERASVFHSLAQELRADRLIAFLQEEALQLLAAAGSERLASLSDGRYRIACRGDEFFVVDTWNGEEERHVRTLSGGETFLASLSLALALADQVRSLSVTDRARLDSLFLDEGFGTLDQDSLGTVVDAIEQLAGDGRLVGVVTHVRELAEQFPRIEVEKSQRGSRLSVVA
jgi:exonuclease SbcC